MRFFPFPFISFRVRVRMTKKGVMTQPRKLCLSFVPIHPDLQIFRPIVGTDSICAADRATPKTIPTFKGDRKGRPYAT